MAQPHPHTGATYRVIRRADNAYEAEVNIEGMNPTFITGFATQALAEAWVEKHKREIADYTPGWRGRGRSNKKP